MTNPTQHWPELAVTTFNKTMQQTPHGCGACCHAEWVFAAEKWTVGACRQAVKLDSAKVAVGDEFRSVGGYDPALYCTAQNAGVDTSTLAVEEEE